MLSDLMLTSKIDILLTTYREIMLIAPTGAGKTTMLLEIFENTDNSILFLSPLRALADEVFERTQQKFGGRNVKRIQGEESFELLVRDLEKNKKRFAVATVEHIKNGYLEHLNELTSKLIVVIDEVHLFFHWGNDFRPHLLDCYYEIRFFNMNLLSLTATLSPEQAECYQDYCNLCGESTLIINLGNYGLKKNPEKIHYYHDGQKKLIYRDLWRRLKTKNENETIMVFVAFRKEVDDLIDRFRRHGYCAIGCVSGEVDVFKKTLQSITDNKENLDVIVATTCLSHGVNLPMLSAVFLLYPIQHRDFWVQMIGRAGRRGETFEVYEMNGYDAGGFRRKKTELKICSIKNQLKHGFLDWWGI